MPRNICVAFVARTQTINGGNFNWQKCTISLINLLHLSICSVGYSVHLELFETLLTYARTLLQVNFASMWFRYMKVLSLEVKCSLNPSQGKNYKKT